MFRAAPRRERKSTPTSFDLKVRAYGSFWGVVSSAVSPSSAARSIGTKRFGRAVTARRFGVRPKRLRVAAGGGDGEGNERKDDERTDGDDRTGSARKRLKFETLRIKLAEEAEDEEDDGGEEKKSSVSAHWDQARRVRLGASVACDDEVDRAADEKSDEEQKARAEIVAVGYEELERSERNDDKAAAAAAETGERETKGGAGEQKAATHSDEKKRGPRTASRSFAASRGIGRRATPVVAPNLELEDILDDPDAFERLMLSIDAVVAGSEEDVPSLDDYGDDSCGRERKDAGDDPRDDERDDAGRSARDVAKSEKKRRDAESPNEAPAEPTATEAADMRDLKVILVRPSLVRDLPDIKCSVCGEVFLDPFEIKTCRHVFCNVCLERSLGAKPQCPLCRGDTKVGAADAASLAVSSVGAYRILFGSLKIRCALHKDAGCTWTGDYTAMRKHLMYSCAEHPIVCFNCHAHYRRRDMAAHLLACPRRSVTCAECKHEGEFRYAERHRTADCPMAFVRCWSGGGLDSGDGGGGLSASASLASLFRPKNNGCGRRMRRKDLGEHRRRVCKMRRVACAYGCAEPVLWSAVDAHNARNAVRHVAFASDRIERLERRLEAYERRLPSTAATDVASSRSDVIYRRDDGEVGSQVVSIDVGMRRRHGEVVGWRRLPEIPNLRYHPTIAQTERGLFVVDFKTATWKRCAPLPMPLDGHTVTALKIGDDSLMYVVGGRETPRHCCVYNPGDDSWSERPAPDQDRWDHTAVACGGQLYVFGGHSPAGECYDPVANQWTACAPMKRARCFAAAVVVDAFVYVMGGVTTSASAAASTWTSRWTRSVECYDTRTDTWTVAAWKLPRAMSSFVAHCDSRGSIVVAGGVRASDGSSSAYRDPTGVTEIYSLDLNSDSGEWRII